MGSEDDINNDGDMGFHHQQQQHPKVSTVSAMEMSSGSMFKSPNGSGHLFGSGWDPLVSLNQGGDFGASHASEFASTSAYPVGLENEGLLHHYHRSDSVLGEMAPKLGCFGSGSFSEMVNSFVGLPECGQITNITTQSQKDEGASPNRREKRRTSHSPFKPNNKQYKSGDGEQQDDVSGDSSENMKDQNEKKQKMEHGINPNSRPKQMGKQAKENSDSGGAPKENYIHVRAKRGQATNSHSLAERVRREKISERMKLLQELVPGCNKITGKAVMLDEIINYVQSLQQQVEFLSMKLATVNPELNIDVDRILSKDNLHLRGSNSNHALLGFIPGLSSSNPYPQGSMPTGIPTTAPFHPIHPQPVWDNNLHNLLQMGFDSNAATNNLGPNGGHSKLEL